MTEISIRDISDIRIGQVENADAGTGCTVLVCKKGMRAGIDIRGGGPASRETPLLSPLMSAKNIHAVVLAGGSAFGLGAANGVMQYLEEQNIGYDVGVLNLHNFHGELLVLLHFIRLLSVKCMVTGFAGSQRYCCLPAFIPLYAVSAASFSILQPRR